MKHRLKKNTAAEQAYVRDLERCGPLEKVERGEAKLLPVSEYPEPLRRFLERESGILRVPPSPAAKKRLEQLSRATGSSMDELARRWVEQGLAPARRDDWPKATCWCRSLRGSLDQL